MISFTCPDCGWRIHKRTGWPSRCGECTWIAMLDPSEQLAARLRLAMTRGQDALLDAYAIGGA